MKEKFVGTKLSPSTMLTIQQDIDVVQLHSIVDAHARSCHNYCTLSCHTIHYHW